MLPVGLPETGIQHDSKTKAESQKSDFSQNFGWRTSKYNLFLWGKYGDPRIFGYPLAGTALAVQILTDLDLTGG